MTRALVLGGGFAGVLFALALAEHVDEVALVEGATYRGAGERNGLPQAHHNHVLVSAGRGRSISCCPAACRTCWRTAPTTVGCPRAR